MELCKIGEYRDWIYESEGKWYKCKKISKITNYNGEAITTQYFSTTGELTIGATVYYILSTSIEEEITDPTLISQLNELKKLHTYKGTTNIYTVTEGLNPTLKVTYKNEMPKMKRFI